ncbi:MAG: hypothetical protein AAFN51_10210 [Pseudomonadota bacterium]
MMQVSRWLVVALLLVLWHPVKAEACDSEAACLDAYAKATVDRDTPIDMAAADAALRAGCEQRQTGEACRILSYLVGRSVLEGSENDRGLFNRYGCEAGDRIACRFLVNDRVNTDTWGAVRGIQSQQIREMLEDRCSDGDDFVCRVLVRYISDEDAGRYRVQCDTGRTAYCALLGGYEYYPLYQRGPLAARAEKTFRDQCEVDEGLGCIFLADLLERGHGANLTEDRLPHLQRACDLGVGHGCDVSHLILSTREPHASRETLDALMRRSCDLENPLACLRVARIDRWTNDDTKIAYAQALRKDCLSGGWRSCEAAASVYEAIRYLGNLAEQYDDVDQMIENYFQFAEILKGR